MKPIYLLLTCSETLFSRAIRLFTGAVYTHVSLSADAVPPLLPAVSGCDFYSFGRQNPFFPFPAGFVTETGRNGYIRHFPQTRCALLALDIPEQAHREIFLRLRNMKVCASIYRYNLLGALSCGFGLPLSRKRRYFCSQFVGELLSRSHAVVLPKPAALMHPADFAELDGIRVLYTGTAGELFAFASVKMSAEVIKLPDRLAIR